MKAYRIVAALLLTHLVLPSAAGAETPSGDRIGLTLLVTSATSGRLFGEEGETIGVMATAIQHQAAEARMDGRSVVILDAGRTVLPNAESRFDGGRTMMEVLRAAGCAVFAPAPIDFAIGTDRMQVLAETKPNLIVPFTAAEENAAVSWPTSKTVAVTETLALEIHSILDPSFTGDLVAVGLKGAEPVPAPTDPPSPGVIRLAVVHSKGRSSDLASHTLTWNLVEHPGGLDLLFDPDLGADVVLRSVADDRPVLLAGRNQTGGHSWSFARLDVDLRLDNGRWIVDSGDLTIVDPEVTAPTDTRLAAALETAATRFQEAQVAHFGDDAPNTRDELQAFVLQAARERARAEVAVLNQGAVRPVDPVHFQTAALTREAVVRLLSFDQLLVVGTLTGSNLVDLATASARRLGPDGTLNKNCLLFQGVTFSVDHPGTASATVSKLKVNGRPVRPDDLYRVVTNHYLASGGDTYPILSEMDGDWLRDDRGEPLELRSEVVEPRLNRASVPFVDLSKQAVWHWGLERLSLGYFTVSTDHDPSYADNRDSRARAEDSTATLGEFRAFADREKPAWSWENLLTGKYGLLDLKGAGRRETVDEIRFETSAVFSTVSVLGGDPYASVNFVSEFRPADKDDGGRLPRRFEQSLAAGIDWTTGHWSRIRLGLSTRNYANADRDQQSGVIAEAFYKRKPAGGWPGIDAHLLGEVLTAGDSDISRFDLDLRFPFPLYRRLALTPAVNYYSTRDTALTGDAQFFRFSLNLGYSWVGKHQTW